MSRIGKLPITLPQGVKVDFSNNIVTVEGIKGKLSKKISEKISIDLKEGQIILNRKMDTKEDKALHGLYRSLIFNMVIGVSQGFSKTLLINGIGYRAELKDKSLFLNLGYSTQFEYILPEGITAKLDGNTKVTILGIDKEKVGQVAAEIKKFKKPDPYKGKGIQYEGEVLKKKVGKSGVK